MNAPVTKQILVDLIPTLLDAELTLIRNWRTYNNAIIKFKNMSNIPLFISILDDKDEALRLLKHYKEVKYTWDKFETYLTEQQKNLFYVFILKYCL